MTPELTVLALSVILQSLQFVLYSVAAQRQVGTRYAAGPRDEPRALTGVAGRLQRALNNHFEAMTMFCVTVVVVHLSGQSTPLTASCAWIWLAARVVYVPAYALGWTPWRSVVWFVGFFAMLTMIGVALI